VPNFGKRRGNSLVRLPLDAPDLPSVFKLLKSHARGVFWGGGSSLRGNKLDQLALLRMGVVWVGIRAARQSAALLTVSPLEQKIQEHITSENAYRQENCCRHFRSPLPRDNPPFRLLAE
jgi:uridylate kinase